MPSIITLGTAVPEKSYSQDYIFKALGHRRIFADLFESAGIDKRHLSVDPAEMVNSTPQQQHESAHRFALELSVKSIQDCLGRAGAKPTDIDELVLVSCTVAFQSPALNWEIAHALGMREDVIHVPLSGAGCAGAGPGLRRAWEHLRLYPQDRVLVCTTEVSHAAYHPSTDLGVVLGNSLFADGSSCYMVEALTKKPGLSMLDMVELHDYEHRFAIALVWDEARYKIVLPTRASELTTPMLRRVLEKLLSRAGLRIGDIAHFAFHSGGKSILEAASADLGIPREKMADSYWVWQNYGNCSSATVGLSLERLLGSGRLKDGDYVVIAVMGAGFTAQALLTRWRAA